MTDDNSFADVWIDRLAALRRSAETKAEPVLGSISWAADETHARWLESRMAMERRRQEYERESAREGALREQLQAILDVGQRLDRRGALGPSGSHTGTGDAQVARRWWHRRGRVVRPGESTVGVTETLAIRVGSPRVDRFEPVPPPPPLPPVAMNPPESRREQAATGAAQAGAPVPSGPVDIPRRRRRPVRSGPEPHLSAAFDVGTPVDDDRSGPEIEAEGAAPPASAVEAPWVRAPLEEDDAARPPDAAVAVRMLGTFRLHQHGEQVQLPGHKAQILLKVLLAQRPRAVPRDVLVELLWPDLDPEAGRRNLHQTVYALRRVLRVKDPLTQHIYFKNDCYGISDDLELWCDVTEFESLAAAGKQFVERAEPDRAIEALSCASELYHGAYLADTPYDEWTIVDRERLRMIFHEVMELLGEMLVRLGRWDEVIAISQRLLRQDPLAEGGHRRIMAAYRARGQRSLAIQQYRICAQALQRELELTPSPDTEALYRSLLG